MNEIKLSSNYKWLKNYVTFPCKLCMCLFSVMAQDEIKYDYKTKHFEFSIIESIGQCVSKVITW